MGRLRKVAKRNARLQYGPVLRDLRRQKQEARALLRTGTRQERQAARGIIASVDQAIRGVSGDYREANAETEFANRIGGAPGSSTIGQGISFSREQTSRMVAAEKAAELSDLRSRMVQAAEAAAYGTRALRGQYQGTLKSIQGERQATKRDMGQFRLSELSRLQDEAAAARREEQALANEQERIAISRGNLRLSRKKERHQERERRLDRREGDGKDGRGPDSVHSQNLKMQIIDARAKIERELNKDVPLKKIRKDAEKNNVNSTVFETALLLARGYRLGGAKVRELKQIGVRVPRAWTRGRPYQGEGVNAIRGIGG
jgi:hypothetical protein